MFGDNCPGPPKFWHQVRLDEAMCNQTPATVDFEVQILPNVAV